MIKRLFLLFASSVITFPIWSNDNLPNNTATIPIALKRDQNKHKPTDIRYDDYLSGMELFGKWMVRRSDT